MTKWILALALPMALIGCSPDDNNGDDGGGSGGGGNDTTGTATITDSNAQAMVERTLPNFDLSDTVNDPFDEFSNMLITGPDDRDAGRTGLSARLQDSVACDTGSASVTTSGQDIGSGTPPADGSASFEVRYNDCVISQSSQSAQISMHMNGTISADFSWTGYDSGMNTFSSYSIDLSMDKLYMEMAINGQSTVLEADYTMKYSLNGTTLTHEFQGSAGFGDLTDGSVSVRTTTPITVDTSTVPARPQSGEIVLNGGNGTSITLTVVANGVEVSVNGGQAELYTWSEVESM